MSSTPPNPSAASGEAQFAIQKIYVKDFSFESPSAPAVFRNEWRPQVELNLHSDASRVAADTYEVVLRVTVTVKLADQTAFLVEVQQAGLFRIGGLTEEQLRPTLGSMCPSILFPYARETVSDVVTRGGFPQLLLSPVNFDALYLRHLKESGEAGADPAAGGERQAATGEGPQSQGGGAGDGSGH